MMYKRLLKISSIGKPLLTKRKWELDFAIEAIKKLTEQIGKSNVKV